MRRFLFAAWLLTGCTGSTLSGDLLVPVPDAGAMTDPDAGGSQVRLHGVVVDATTDAGLANAAVSVGTTQTTTSSNGEFSAEGLSAGLQSVVVTVPTYFDGLFMLQLLPGDNDTELLVERDCTHVRCPGGFVCGLIATCEAGSGPAAVVGLITDSCDDTPRVALVEVTDDLGTVSVCSDTSGHYRVDQRTGGEEVTVKVSSPGYDAWSLPLTLTAGDNDFSHALFRSCSGSAPAPVCP